MLSYWRFVLMKVEECKFFLSVQCSVLPITPAGNTFWVRCTRRLGAAIDGRRAPRGLLSSGHDKHGAAASPVLPEICHVSCHSCRPRTPPRRPPAVAIRPYGHRAGRKRGGDPIPIAKRKARAAPHRRHTARREDAHAPYNARSSADRAWHGNNAPRN